MKDLIIEGKNGRLVRVDGIAMVQLEEAAKSREKCCELDQYIENLLDWGHQVCHANTGFAGFEVVEKYSEGQTFYYSECGLARFLFTENGLVVTVFYLAKLTDFSNLNHQGILQTRHIDADLQTEQRKKRGHNSYIGLG